MRSRDEKPSPHLREWRGLFVRVGDRVVDAPAEDVAVAKSYPAFEDKGPVADGRRITIMTAKGSCAAGEEVRIIHVMEVVEPGEEVLIMGPKPVLGEYVDDRLATPPFPGPDRLYDGTVITSPAVDYNYEITSYVFAQPGVHTVQWRMGPLRSNLLSVTVGAH